MTGEQVLPADEDSLAIRDGKMVGLGVSGPARETLDARGRALLPGFIDCHTHALWAGDRLGEHLARLAGASYQDIAKAGGGILATVKAVRESSEQDLAASALPRLNALLREGVTNIEVKSGYGLDTESELKMLRAIARLRERCGIEHGLSSRGVSRSTIDDLAPPASRDACLFTNPRRASIADIKTIYAEAL